MAIGCVEIRRGRARVAIGQDGSHPRTYVFGEPDGANFKLVLERLEEHKKRWLEKHGHEPMCRKCRTGWFIVNGICGCGTKGETGYDVYAGDES